METVIKQPAIAAIGTALLAVFVLHTIVQWRRLSHVPGPFWAAFSKYWMVKTALRGDQPSALKAANDKYGMYCSALLFQCLRSLCDLESFMHKLI
jgi:hypothetical protein